MGRDHPYRAFAGRMLAVLVPGLLLGASGCAGEPPGLPPETGFITTNDSTTSGSTSSLATSDPATSDPATSNPATSNGSGGLDDCMSDEQCSGATPACDTRTGDCVECLPGGGHCTPEEYCDAAGLECVPGCDEDLDCPSVCDLDAHVCVDCLDSGDCQPPTPVCNTDTNTCAECVTEGDCPTGVCESGECVSLGFPCMDDSVCDTEAGEECCTEIQCLGSCMIRCESPAAECPMDSGMYCAHEYCLFPCETDLDCATWPGFTCQHGNPLLCESD